MTWPIAWRTLMRDKGVLISTDGPHHNVLKIKPPLVVRDADADEFMDGFGAALDLLSRHADGESILDG